MAHYHCPPVTVSLGTVLDLRVSNGDKRIFIDDWEGFLMLTDPNAFDSERPRLWLMKGKLGAKSDVEPGGRAEEAFELWHRRGFDLVSDVTIPDGPIGYYQGRVTSLGYRSDKWTKDEPHDYDHAFNEDGASPPKLYTNRVDLEKTTAALLVGGDMQITEAGIA